MEKVYIVETSTEPGVWFTNSLAYAREEKATDVALKIINDSNKKIFARVSELKIVK